ncbi:hypothetical protein L0U85_00310 [Glycomyces sp. L485]|uniref:hypothetical protein n=1 Tax=Glycomyces sp. L485 TaxID=2909235 RepID=UPI001F4B63CD|nr:hypothetical protein [Glycomyces sp. L485]MCH7229313.1 hypothetical protein [Glycomyces sp. L485]
MVTATTAAALSLVLVAVWFAADQGLIGKEEASAPPLDLTTLRPGDPGTDGIDIRPGERDQCVPYEPEWVWPALNYVECDSDEAFWVEYAASDEVDGFVDAEGTADESAVVEVCGEDYGNPQPGRAWLDVVTFSDTDTGSISYLSCMRAIVTADQSGRLPVMPSVGDCFDDSDSWWTVPCDHEHSIGTVIDVIITPDLPELTDEDVHRVAEHCEGGDSTLEVDALISGGTNFILCYNEH